MSLSLYGFLVGLAFTFFWSLFERALKKQAQLSEKSLFAALIFVAVGSVLGARLYHLWTDWQLYEGAGLGELVAIWNGGLGIYGAIAGGLVGLALWKRWYARHISWLLVLDSAALGLPLGQAIGRWGNFVNQELFGLPTEAPWAVKIDLPNRPLGYEQFSSFHPLFLYENIALLSVAGFFLLLRRKYASLFPLGNGWYIGNYLFAYGMIRFSLELLRIGSAPGWLGITIAQWISVAVSTIGLLLFSRAFRLQWKSDDVDEDSQPKTPARRRGHAVSAPRAKRRSRAGSKSNSRPRRRR